MYQLNKEHEQHTRFDIDKQYFLQHKPEKESGKEWYKMIKNLRFKIHYNHYETNIGRNLSCGFWGDIKDQLRQEFHLREEQAAVEAEIEQEFSVHFEKKNAAQIKKDKSNVSRSNLVSIDRER